jgi:cytochrome b
LTVEGGNPLFQFHILFGLLAAFFAVVRVVWGVIGTRHAQFVRFPLSPVALLAYVGGLFDRNGRRFPGHNPGATWAAIAMFGLVGLLVATGLGGGREAFEDVHEVLAYVLLSTVGLHLAGLATGIFFTGARDQLGAPAMVMVLGSSRQSSGRGRGGEDWWSTSPFSTNEWVRNFSREQILGVLNSTHVPGCFTRRWYSMSHLITTCPHVHAPPQRALA